MRPPGTATAAQRMARRATPKGGGTRWFAAGARDMHVRPRPRLYLGAGGSSRGLYPTRERERLRATASSASASRSACTMSTRASATCRWWARRATWTGRCRLHAVCGGGQARSHSSQGPW
eukprot:7313120-Prymnesium_polylepis.1